MTRYSVQSRDRIFVKSYRLSFGKKMDKRFGENMSKNLSGKYSQKLSIMLKNLQQMRLTLLRK